MLELLKNKANMTTTENGAATFASTHSNCLDLFSTIGALRRRPDEDIQTRFMRAYAEDGDTAMKTLFFARDIRGGLGERRVFKTILRKLAFDEPASVRKNIEYVAEYGRYDDLICLLGTPCEKDAIDCIKAQLDADLAALESGGQVSLLAKWLPSVNTSNPEAVKAAKRIAKLLGMKDVEYRKTLVRLRQQIKIIENNLREKDYTFDYSKQPSKAMFKYRAAFYRNDGERYGAFVESVSRGEAKLHTGTLTPYDIVAPFFDWRRSSIDDEERKAIDATWNAQEDFTGDDNALVVVDGSGSMYSYSNPMPASIAESLAIYFAERSTGRFKNHFITFSCNPQLVEIKGKDIFDKLHYCCSFNEVANTNLQKVFELVLEAAIAGNLPQSELPSTLYIISDMEFDRCAEDASLTNFEYAKRLYAQHGYTLPKVVFWNVASRNMQQPVTMNEQGVALVSGCSPRVFEIIKSKDYSPFTLMIETLYSERYAKITA